MFASQVSHFICLFFLIWIIVITKLFISQQFYLPFFSFELLSLSVFLFYSPLNRRLQILLFFLTWYFFYNSMGKNILVFMVCRRLFRAYGFRLTKQLFFGFSSDLFFPYLIWIITPLLFHFCVFFFSLTSTFKRMFAKTLQLTWVHSMRTRVSSE